MELGPAPATGAVAKVVVLGPESTGKSTLCNRLASHFGVNWCPEYARQYLTEHGKNYTYADLLTIAKGQLALEQQYLAEAKKLGHRLLISDTDQYVMKVWCEYVFGDCHTWILDRIAEQRCDLYLLCAPDLPWVQDELREYPDDAPRQELFHLYRELLSQQNTRWVIVSGPYAERTAAAIQAVQAVLDGKG